MDIRYYKDIDLLSLSGKGELLTEELKYPYLRIDSLSAVKKRVTYFVDKEKSMEYFYEKQNDEWIWIERSIQPDTLYYNIKLIDENRSITYLKYGAANPFKSDSAYLVSVAQFDGTKRCTYIFGGISNVKSPPSSNLKSFPLDKYYTKVVENFQIENGIMRVSEQREFSFGKDQRISDRCFEINDLSVYWYLECYHLLPKTDCN